MKENNNKKKIAVIGGGPAGVMCAIEAAKDPSNEVLIFEQNEVLKTLLCTGGGRCNLAYAEFDEKELTNFYPRGQKFLYSVFSKFSTSDTIEFFDKIGIKTYIQNDMRIFPSSDSAGEVRDALLSELQKSNIKIMKKKISSIEKMHDKFLINDGQFDKVVIATGGRSGHNLAKKLSHDITPLKPALCGLIIEEKYLKILSGLTLQNLNAEVFFDGRKIFEQNGDLLFTHFGISGPLIYKITSYAAQIPYYVENPLEIRLNLVNKNAETFDENLCKTLNISSQKDIINLLSQYIPKKLAGAVLFNLSIPIETKASKIDKKLRKKITKKLTSFSLNAISTSPQGEIVTAGGVNLDEVNPKTMESKLVRGLFFCGEILDIDGLCGGFNLQNCWSSGFVAGNSL